MRFNPRARLDTSRVGDRGGSGGRGPGGGRGSRMPIPGGAKAGGGIGSVLVLLVVLAFYFLDGGGGGSTGPLSTGQLDGNRLADPARYAHCETGEQANEDPDCARVAVENSLFAYWSAELPDAGVRFRPATVGTFSGQVSTACGGASSQVGPFYCPADQGIYLDSTFFSEVLEDQLGGRGGDFVEPYVLAHEYGHHVQNLMGTMGRVRTQQGPRSDAVRLELQADCYAGLWTRAAEGTTSRDGVEIFESVDRTDIEEAVDAARAVGDDRIQQRSAGRVSPEQWTHGSSQQRREWFLTGYDSGDLDACDTFAPDAL